jgi:hypothetical protein
MSSEDRYAGVSRFRPRMFGERGLHPNTKNDKAQALPYPGLIFSLALLDLRGKLRSSGVRTPINSRVMSSTA